MYISVNQRLIHYLGIRWGVNDMPGINVRAILNPHLFPCSLFQRPRKYFISHCASLLSYDKHVEADLNVGSDVDEY